MAINMYVNGEIYAELGKRGNTHWDKNLGEICRSFYFVVHSVFQVSVVANHVLIMMQVLKKSLELTRKKYESPFRRVFFIPF